MFWAELRLDLASTSPDGAQLGSPYGVLPGVQMIQDPLIGLPASLMGLGTSVKTGSLTPRTKKAASGDQQESPPPQGAGRRTWGTMHPLYTLFDSHERGMGVHECENTCADTCIGECLGYMKKRVYV